MSASSDGGGVDGPTPRPVGQVAALIGSQLGADVELPDGEGLARFEIELVSGRRDERSRVWKDPLWTYRSDEPRFVTVDGHHAFDGMIVKRRRPRFGLAASRPIDAYSWELRQDGDVIDAAADSSRGISSDGLSFTFRPEQRLRRSGRPGKPRRTDVFYPPVDSHLPDVPRTEDSRIHYSALTHAGHDEQDAYAVDLNWGAGGADRGHWVRAAAAGRVSRIDPANGQVHIEHPQFDGSEMYETVYAHLDPILVKPGRRVEAQQRIGRIGATYHGSGPISPHLHHQHLKDGKPTKMTLLIFGEETPIGVSRPNPGRTLMWDRKVSGWIKPRGPARAALTVRTRSAADGSWSGRNRLVFIVASRHATVPAEQDAMFEPVTLGGGIDYVYNGPGVDPGEYTVRYRAHGDAGTETPWAYDDSAVVEPTLA